MNRAANNIIFLHFSNTSVIDHAEAFGVVASTVLAQNVLSRFGTGTD